MKSRPHEILSAQGHLIDSGIMTEILNLIIEEGGDYQILELKLGKHPHEESSINIQIYTADKEALVSLTDKLTRLGMYIHGGLEAVFSRAEKDKFAPESFYSTTNHRTDVYMNDTWNPVSAQRMDAAIVRTAEGLVCTKLRDIKKGDEVLCGSQSVRVHPPMPEKKEEDFGFMSNDVSSERQYNLAAEKMADELKLLKEQGKKVVVVAGPVVVHTGGAPALAALIRDGYIHGFLGGNAIAVHDLEAVFYKTSLGVDVRSGKPTHGGHNHHMRAINKINGHGSIKEAILAGALRGGLMYEIETSGIPYCLAGSIRDDGPLPETEADMIKAQQQYSHIIKDSSAIIMLSSMLHSIGTGNMTPSWVKTYCVDINPAVVTKLSDRGTGQAVGIVSDVGLFLRALAQRLGCDIQEFYNT